MGKTHLVVELCDQEEEASPVRRFVVGSQLDRTQLKVLNVTKTTSYLGASGVMK